MESGVYHKQYYDVRVFIVMQTLKESWKRFLQKVWLWTESSREQELSVESPSHVKPS